MSYIERALEKNSSRYVMLFIDNTFSLDILESKLQG